MSTLAVKLVLTDEFSEPVTTRNTTVVTTTENDLPKLKNRKEGGSVPMISSSVDTCHAVLHTGSWQLKAIASELKY